MNTPVYAEQITSLSDARYFSGMGARWLGICANPSDQAYLSPERFREISGWVSGPQFVIEAEGLPDDFDAASLSAAYGISVFRIRNHQSGSVNGYEFGLDMRNTSSSVPEEAAFMIVKSAAELTKSAKCPQLINGPYETDRAEEILNQFPETGFVIAGSAEAAVGLKEYDAREFLEYLDSRES